MPTIRLIDLRQQRYDEGLSNPLIQKMRDHLDAGYQVLLFLNRRGYAPLLLCHACGWSAECPRCDARLTIHNLKKQLCCHHCGTLQSLPQTCTACDSANLLQIGLGTQRIEHALQKHFPDLPILRIDSDTTRRKGALDEMLDTIQEGKKQILLGTQMLAKGHHFPNVTLVAILEADTGLYRPDYLACEHMGQLLLQVAGRAGRGDQPGEVCVQTHYPDHPLLQILLHKGYNAFASTLLEERQAATLPPFSSLALLRAEATKQTAPYTFLTAVYQLAHQHINPAIQIYGPTPATLARKAGHYRAQLLLHAPRQQLQAHLTQLIPKLSSLPEAKKVRWTLDVDPLEM